MKVAIEEGLKYYADDELAQLHAKIKQKCLNKVYKCIFDITIRLK